MYKRKKTEKLVLIEMRTFSSVEAHGKRIKMTIYRLGETICNLHIQQRARIWNTETLNTQGLKNNPIKIWVKDTSLTENRDGQ